MTAKVATVGVSYGIGVQNRYSAFLDEDDALAVGQAGLRRPSQPMASKQKSPAASNKQASNVLKSNLKAAEQKKTNGEQPKRLQETRKVKPHNLTQDKQPHNNAAFANRQTNKQANFNQDHTANTKLSKYSHHQQNSNNNNNNNNNINHSNQHHQLNVSQQNSASKENSDFNQQQQQPTKFVRNHGQVNQRPSHHNHHHHNNNQRRQYFNNHPQQQTEEAITNEFGSNADEEKRRRQQKRAIDLKHKDPEKKEARRQQAAAGQANESQNHMAKAEQANPASRPQRFRRQNGDQARNSDDSAAAANTNPMRTGPGARVNNGPRGPRQENETGDERRTGNVQNRLIRNGDRPQRNRNGFGSGSRNGRGPKGDENQANGKFVGRDSEKKPIPNFSDKLDFPSLAS